MYTEEWKVDHETMEEFRYIKLEMYFAYLPCGIRQMGI